MHPGRLVNYACSLNTPPPIVFGIDRNDGGGAMAEDYSRGFEAELAAEFGGGVVVELVRVPAVDLLLLCQASLPLGVGFVLTLGQRFGRGERNGSTASTSRIGAGAAFSGSRASLRPGLRPGTALGRGGPEQALRNP